MIRPTIGIDGMPTFEACEGDTILARRPTYQAAEAWLRRYRAQRRMPREAAASLDEIAAQLERLSKGEGL